VKRRKSKREEVTREEALDEHGKGGCGYEEMEMAVNEIK
jgi:hypothetical protein